VSTYYPSNANLTPYPPTVTNLNSYGSDNSGNMVRRFWKIDLTGSSSPKVNVRFYYAAAESPSIGNTNMLARAGNSKTTKAYETMDKQPYRGISYYRLKQTDLNGSTEYSKSVSVNFRTTVRSMELFQTQYHR
jgi:hypothetical protein